MQFPIVEFRDILNTKKFFSPYLIEKYPNYVDYDDPSVQSRKCLEVCIKHNKSVEVMKPVRFQKIGLQSVSQSIQPARFLFLQPSAGCS